MVRPGGVDEGAAETMTVLEQLAEVESGSPARGIKLRCTT
jgi:hypothetical protein